MQMRMSGGSSETEVKEFMVIPRTSSPKENVTTDTPVTHRRMACRSASPFIFHPSS
jgi:hypothetical protein